MLSSGLVLLLAATATLGALVYWIDQRRQRQPLVSPPVPYVPGGHWLVGFLTDMPHLLDHFTRAGRMRQKLQLFCMGSFDLVLVNDADYIKKAFQASSQRFPSDYDFVVESHGVFALTEDKWRPMRRRLDQYFTRSNISNMFPQVLASAKDTAERLALQAKANPPAHYHNLVPVISRSVMDSLVRCVFSREFDEVTDTARMRAIELANWYKAADFLNNVPVIKHFNPLKKDYIKYLHMLNDLSKLEVDARRELYEVDPSSAPNDLLTNILGYGIRPTLDDMQFSYENEVHNVGTFFFAGLDTTTNSLLFTIALLCKHPEIMKRATEEVDRVFAELMGVHLDQESQLVPKLVYLDKIIKEATRLYPGTVGTSRVPHEDLQLGDHVIRKGTRLMLNAGAMSRSPLHWERPDEFYPEHFNEDVTKARHPMAYFPFGGGPRICIGFRLAVQEQRVILAHLLHNFTFESHPDQKIEVFSGLTNNFIGPLLVRIAPRNHQ